eukprot:TRINITY_DN1659_c0_g1_i1.p2 TRINITY_DN1659_c0_g1~~TRINITY_DN1659_c0_g1_i1.p2  ORF type:complete len:690 (-),score=70.92 TRINITY_DN1659_c0_g1_i1:11422-13491(-)
MLVVYRSMCLCCLYAHREIAGSMYNAYIFANIVKYTLKVKVKRIIMEDNLLLTSGKEKVVTPVERSRTPSEKHEAIPTDYNLLEPRSESDLEHPELEVAEIELEPRVEYIQVPNPQTLQVTIRGETEYIGGSAFKNEAEAVSDFDFLNGFTPLQKDNQKLHYLKYGDKIKLQVQKGAETFHLYSDGFATRRVFLQHGSGASAVCEVFRVVPRFEHEQLTRLRQDLAALLKSKRRVRAAVPDNGYRALIKEEIQNTLTRRKELLGQPVHYRDQIQLIHEETQQFLAVSKNVEFSEKSLGEGAQLENDLGMLLKSGVKKDIMRAYSLKLQPHASAETHFMLVPCHKYQEAGYVLEEDSFYFAYADPKLLGKSFHLHFPSSVLDTIPANAYNVYLYEEVKTTVKYESINEAPYRNHLFKILNRKAIWITHIEAPLFLCLESIEKSTEQEENELGELIMGVSEALSHNFSLGFKKYDENETQLSPKGMWIVTACPEDPRKVVFKHLLYDVWLKPLFAENVVRGEAQKGSISDGSVLKLRLPGSKDFISVSVSILSSATKTSSGTGASSGNTSDYTCCFKIIQAKEQEKLQNYALSHLTMFIRSYDEQVLRKIYDFTAEATFEMLSGALKCMKRLCLNTLPAAYDPILPFKVPNEAIQRVTIKILSTIIVVQGIEVHRCVHVSAIEAVPSWGEW